MKANDYRERIVDGFGHAPDERTRVLLQDLVRHLLDFAIDVDLTTDEWLAGIDFLDRAARVDGRSEFMLTSDMLGLSAMVDFLATPAPEGATQPTPYGPFYKAGIPEKQRGDTINLRANGDDRPELVVSGRVLDLAGSPVPGALVDVWQDDPNGLYDVQDPEQPDGNMRGVFRTDDRGEYRFRSLTPTPYPVPTDGPVGDLLRVSGRHPMRPAHIHARVIADGFTPLVTHIYVNGDPYIDSDVAFGRTDGLRAEFTRSHDPQRAAELGVRSPFDELVHDFVLVRLR